MINFGSINFQDKQKENIQRQAFDEWQNHDYKGTLEMATGVGKTLIGVMAIQQNLITASKIFIVVPKIDLQDQWIKEIHEQLGDIEVGRLGGGYKELDKKIIVAVINSIRDLVLVGDLLIMDEIHRVGSAENFKFLKNGSFKKILGLTATSERQDGAHRLIFEHAPLIHEFNQSKAIQEKILSEFILINHALTLNQEEQQKYDRANWSIKSNFQSFGYDFRRVQSALYSNGMMSIIAGGLMKAFGERKTVILTSKNKILYTILLIKKENKKTIVFCEYIKTANEIVSLLKSEGIPSAKYHSGMSKSAKEKMLEKFKKGEHQIMVTVKSLDEGTNVPDCEMAIITGGTSVKRQMIQRLGRILRKYEGKEVAKVYQLYIANTKDEDWVKKRSEGLSKNAIKVIWE